MFILEENIDEYFIFWNLTLSIFQSKLKFPIYLNSSFHTLSVEKNPLIITFAPSEPLFKGPIPSILVVFYIINQKPTIPKTDFHCMFFWIRQCIC